MDLRAIAGVEHEERLDSWKEIAAYFRRDPRTVKRWEKERALPVHRIPGKGRSGVYAYADELRRWLEHHPVDAEAPMDAQLTAEAENAPVERSPSARRPVALLALLLLGIAGMLWVSGTARRSRHVPGGRATDPEIAQAYLECRYAWSKRSPDRLHEAVDCFNRLIERADRFAPAYAGLADTYNLLREYSLMRDSDAFPRAIAAARKAVELDPDSSLGHRALAFAAFNWSFDVPTAEQEFRTAIALDPQDAEAHHWFATSLMLLGRYVEALEEIGRAQELEPTSSSIVADRAFILYAAGQQEEALKLASRLARTEPALISPHHYLAEMYFNRGEYQRYLEESRRFAELRGDPDSLAAVTEEEHALWTGGPKAFLEQLLVQRQIRYERGSAGAYPVAQIESLLGNRDQALFHLEEAIARHETLAMGMGIDPPLENLRGSPRYRELLARLGLSATLSGGPLPHSTQ
ncbi:MAG TPA: tetratricopeptide repeat protein [Myxococcaceae bacterium]|jgi:tetratricopeptide (TPR) repeat protein